MKSVSVRDSGTLGSFHYNLQLSHPFLPSFLPVLAGDSQPITWATIKESLGSVIFRVTELKYLVRSCAKYSWLGSSLVLV